MNLNKYHGAAIISFIIWGFMPFPLRALTDYPSEQILYFRILFSVTFLVALTLLFKRDSIRKTITLYKEGSYREKRKFTFLTLLGGLLLTINWLVFIYVINHISIQTGSFSYILCPILTALLGFLILKEKLAVNQWVAIFLSLISCFIIGTGSLLHLLFSLSIAASYAFYLITQRVLKQYDKMVLLTLQLLIMFMVLGPFYSYFNAGKAIGLDYYFFGVITILSLVFTILPLFLNLYALKELKSGTLGILLYINPIINFCLAFWYFKEQTSSERIVAYILILISVIIYNLKFKKKKKKPLPLPI